MSRQDKLVTVLEVALPFKGNIESLAGRIPRAGKFLSGELGYTRGQGITLSANGITFGFTGGGVPSQVGGPYAYQTGAIQPIGFGVISDDSSILAKVNGGRSPYSELNGAIAELQGYNEATNGMGHIGIQAPGKTSIPGADYVTLDPSIGTITIWDAKYRGPQTSYYPKFIPDSKINNWMPEVGNSIERMSAGPAKDMALDAFLNGRIEGSIFKWPK